MTDIYSEKWIHIYSDDDSILKEEWQEIKNTKYMNKPTGGLWLSKYNGEEHNICEWLNYVQDEICKNGEHSSLYRMATEYKGGLVVDLRKNANIAIIESETDLNYFMSYFSLSDCSLDYEKLSRTYDGIYIKIFSLPSKYWSEYQDNKFNFKTWGCNTLLIFNYDIIKNLSKVDIQTDVDFRGEINYIVHNKTYRKVMYERKGHN